VLTWLSSGDFAVAVLQPGEGSALSGRAPEADAEADAEAETVADRVAPGCG
jgi:hypothetical protein